ncbi:hypothetical protein AMS68_006434 [Peltaster fructicola]|uniref:Major facilitator superfamily (MFS) profile domain-containing protein n=1 Tax=Peltaster fructicola TaxID=286661 RepID=A0A6H0Y1Q7_9PEZI|nr:hypothetical protein AMS68_006434 [Peltaster fructicola]
MIGATIAADHPAAPPLIVQPWEWPCFYLTLCLIPILIASLGTILVTGRMADVVSNCGERRRPDGKRAPEDQLLNLVLPTISGVVGTLLCGIAGGPPTLYPWPVFLAGLGLLAFGLLGANTVGTVYVLEYYPEMGGSALLSIASIRYIVAFFLSFRISDWVVDSGCYFKSFLIYTLSMAVYAAMLPLLWRFGPAWRVRFPCRRMYV